MFDKLRYNIAVLIAPKLKEEVRELARELGSSVLIGDYQCQFYEGATDNPEDGLPKDEQTQYQLWAKSNVVSPWFKHYIRWIINTQANYAIRHAPNERTADFARATINAAELIENGVVRLSAIFDAEQEEKRGVNFDPNITGLAEIE